MCLGEGGLRGAKEATYIFRRKNKNEEKKKSVTEACLAHTPALGAGSGGARGGEAGWMEVRIQIENRWDFSCQPDIRDRGRRGETSLQRGWQPRDMVGGPPGAPPKKSQFGLKSLLIPAFLGLQSRRRGARWNWVVFNTLRGSILPLSV